jgi:hypothetical protein
MVGAYLAFAVEVEREQQSYLFLIFTTVLRSRLYSTSYDIVRRPDCFLHRLPP